MEETRAILAGEEPTKDSVNRIDDVPHGFKDWVKDNEYRIKSACSIPYFMQDNGTISNGKFALKEFEKSINKQVMTDTEISEFELRRNLTKLRDACMEGYLNLSVDLDSISNDIELGEFEKAQSRISPLLTSVERRRARTADDIRRIQDLADERKYGKAYVENVHKIEQALGVQRGKRMTHEQANTGRVNPLYGGGFGYDTNCSTCSATYILRSMGFNVQAKANVPKNTNVEALSKGITVWDKWENGVTKYNSTKLWMANKGYKRMNPKRYEQFINEHTQETGIYEFVIGYKGGGGHSTLLRRNKNGSLERIEQQTTTSCTLTEFLTFLEATPHQVRGIFRVDNAVFKSKYADIVEVVK